MKRRNSVRFAPKNAKMFAWLKTVDEDQARAMGTTVSYLRLIAYGHKRPSAKLSTTIEKATCGQVTRKELRPNDWHEIWPEIDTDR